MPVSMASTRVLRFLTLFGAPSSGDAASTVGIIFMIGYISCFMSSRCFFQVCSFKASIEIFYLLTLVLLHHRVNIYFEIETLKLHE